MHALFTFFLSLLFLTSQREWCEEKSKETSEESTHWLLTICLSSLLLCSFFIPLHYISSLFWFFILLSLWLCSFVMERKWSTKWTKPKRKEKQNQELCVLCFFFVHLAYFVLHSHTITNKPIRTKRNKEHTFTTPLCSFIRLVCNGLKRWRKHETSRIKETKNVVFSVVLFVFFFFSLECVLTLHFITIQVSKRNTKEQLIHHVLVCFAFKFNSRTSFVINLKAKGTRGEVNERTKWRRRKHTTERFITSCFRFTTITKKWRKNTTVNFFPFLFISMK